MKKLNTLGGGKMTFNDFCRLYPPRNSDEWSRLLSTWVEILVSAWSNCGTTNNSAQNTTVRWSVLN